MSHKAISISLALFVIIVAGMFGFAYLKKQEMRQAQVPQEEQKPGERVLYADVTRITAKHFFVDGVHTLVGEVPMPTPCDLLETNAIVAESFPEQVTIDFTVLNTAETCIQQVTNQRFQVTATASKDATFSARFAGRSVELNLVPAVPGEKPEDFELFIKG